MTRHRHRRNARPLAREEGGFTLVELLIGATIGLGVVLAGLGILDSMTRITRSTQARTDSSQRARLAMEIMTRELRSQVCLSQTAPSLTTASDTKVVFYVNLGVVDSSPERHEISFENGDVILRRWVGTGTPPTMSWPLNATRTTTLLENVAPIGITPYLRYYGWANGDPVVPTTLLAPTPLSAANLALPVRIAIAFRALASRDFRHNAQGATELQDSLFVRTADPTDVTKGPRC